MMRWLVPLIVVLAGCGGADTTTTAEPTTTTTSPTTTISPTTTSTTEPGPRPIPSGFAEPGEYQTTVFQPTVMYHVERKHILNLFEVEKATGMQSRQAFPGGGGTGVAPYKGVAIHNHWLGLTPDEIVGELGELDTIEYGPTTQTEVGGFPGTQIEATVAATTVLRQTTGLATASAWFFEPGQQMRFIVLETPAGSLLITVSADVEEWNDFLPVAEEILSGISFPDLEGR